MARVALKANLTFDQAMNHSLTRLQLLDRQADSLFAERELVRLNVLVVAAAAPWSKEAMKGVREVEASLRAQL